jgi:hypothetical protein
LAQGIDCTPLIAVALSDAHRLKFDIRRTIMPNKRLALAPKATRLEVRRWDGSAVLPLIQQYAGPQTRSTHVKSDTDRHRRNRQRHWEELVSVETPTEVCEKMRRDGGSVFPATVNTIRGLSANEIAAALISIMAPSVRLHQRPDTLMQDRSPPTRRNLLATHGRTIHLGHQ